MASRRAAPLLPAALVAVGVWLLVSLIAGPVAEQPRSFVTGVVAPGSLSGAQALRGQRRTTAARGFKEDFDAWKSALTDEEKAQIQEQAEGEFNKKFRKSEAFKKNLPEDKITSFAKVLGKFFDAEAEDYKKEVEGKAPDYDGLLKKAAEGGLDFTLKEAIVEINRDADRRYQMASIAKGIAMEQGQGFPESSPMVEWLSVQNNDTASHETNKKILEFVQEAAKQDNCPPDAKEKIAELVKKGIPPMGEQFVIDVPTVLAAQVGKVREDIVAGLAAMSVEKSEEEAIKFAKTEVPVIGAEVIAKLTEKYVSARDEIEGEVEKQKAFFRSQKEMPGKTKADVLKELWAELPKYSEVPVPPLDDEMLAELAQEPASTPGELLHPWGTADKLYRSEAIDAFGYKYLLGLFETKKECHKAFADWNKEYLEARKNLKEELAQWSKQEQAKKAADVATAKRMEDMYAEAKAGTLK